MLERLRDRLRSGDPPTVAEALAEVRALRTGGLALAEDVIRLLKADAFPVRRAAADALVSMGGEAAELLSIAIRAESERAGQPLVWALELAPSVMERIGSSAALPAARCLVHRYAYFVGAVALAQMADAEVDLSVAAPLAVEGLDPAVDAKRLSFALDAVSHLGSRAVEALPAMAVLLDDRRPEVRAKAVRALYDLGPAAAPALPHLERLLAYPESAGGVPAGMLAAAIRRISGQE
jgi:HEAT repeat protein